ncbi:MULTISPECIES: MBL fold metallo-hydrolase [Actinosynnema]|nr:Glyoxylase, beta-lactamase superfamily II [Actinosynnema pretiosum]
MRVHHLDCGTMRLPGARVVTHVLLLETPTGLALVDTGYGTADIAAPARRLGAYRHVIRPVLDRAETAVEQVRGLGFAPEDVRDVVVTHFDTDHVGGLADFPWARVHVTATEWEAASRPSTALERGRYRAAQWEHGPQVSTHGPGGESWRGFAAARELTDVAPGVVLVPLPGHTRGHAAVAVDAGSRLVLHAGDAFYDHRTLTGGGTPPLALRAQERAVAHDHRLLRANQERLAELHRQGEQDLLLVNAHDPALLAAAR